MAYNQKLRGGGPSSTAWSKQKSRSGGFYASDTIISRQHHPQPSQKPSGRNAKAKVVKSKEIIQLEELIDTLERGIPENVGGPHGCFCLGETTPSD
ncbi:hypothetical protein FRC02_010353 [Tulasnella sp. 418]|nr:hypothetical protein FRC02_010353 [Tulasnella sp. 418]